MEGAMHRVVGVWIPTVKLTCDPCGPTMQTAGLWITTKLCGLGFIPQGTSLVERERKRETVRRNVNPLWFNRVTAFLVTKRDSLPTSQGVELESFRLWIEYWG